MASWTFFVGILLIVSAQRWAEADNLVNLSQEVLKKLKTLDAEIANSLGDEKCKSGVKTHADWLKKEVDVCLKAKKAELKSACEQELAKYPAMIDNFVDTLQRGCQGY
uniref:Uncharacterized protein n=1 Tax=Cuerna arida TaxID=1464854 RepID=A0A1B6EWQ3_9HEMI